MKYINSTVKYILVILMITMTILTFYQVVTRYVFNNPPSWSEELVRFLFVWASFIGAGIGIKEHVHIGIDVFVNLLPEKYRRSAVVLVNLIIIGFGIFLIFSSLPVVKMTNRQLSPANGIPMSYIYFSVVIMGILCILYSLFEIKDVFSKNAVKLEEKVEVIE